MLFGLGLNMEFKDTLLIGCEFENIIATPFLKKTFRDHWVVPTHDHKLTKAGDSYYGPRMHKQGERSLILPDYQLYGDPNLWVEVKYKDNPFSITGYYGKKFIAIEESKCLQYQEVSRVTNSELVYLIGCGETRGLYFVNPEIYVQHIFTNKYGSGPVFAFEINDTNKVGDF